MAISQNFPSVRPTLDLNFAATKRLDSRITFSRGSVGTYHDSTGTIQIAAPHVARFDHNPATGESLGLLVEEARTNQITYSNTGFQEANVQRFAGLAPDGTFTAALVTNNISNGNYVSPGAGTFTYSIFVKQGTSTTFNLQYAGYGFTDWTFTFATESFVVSTVAGWTNASMQKLPNGWYRLSATHADRPFYYYGFYGDAGTATVYFWGHQREAGSFPTSYIPTPATFTGRASTATFYNSSGIIQTAAAGVARSAAFFPDSNGVFRPAGLLLEAAGTNLLLRSQELDNATDWGSYYINYTSNATTAPDGTTTAEKAIPATANVSHSNLQNVTGAISGTYTFSIYAKASGYNRLVLYIDGASAGGLFGSGSAQFDLSTKAITGISGSAAIETLPNGWYRCSVTGTSASAVTVSTGFSIYDNSGNSVFAGNGTDGIFLWGAQLEASPYATSYIPTAASTVTRAADTSTSATVTRSADVAQITGTNFSSWYNQNEGTVFADTTDIGYPVNYGGSLWKIFASTSHVSGRNSINLNRSSGAALPEARFGIIDQNATNQVDLNTATSPTKARVKSAIALKSALYAATSHGNTTVTSSVAVPLTFVAADTLAFGQAQNATTQDKSCLIARLTYWPTRLSDAILQQITR